jgi:hypothetical protein
MKKQKLTTKMYSWIEREKASSGKQNLKRGLRKHTEETTDKTDKAKLFMETFFPKTTSRG